MSEADATMREAIGKRISTYEFDQRVNLIHASVATILGGVSLCHVTLLFEFEAPQAPSMNELARRSTRGWQLGARAFRRYPAPRSLRLKTTSPARLRTSSLLLHKFSPKWRQNIFTRYPADNRLQIKHAPEAAGMGPREVPDQVRRSVQWKAVFFSLADASLNDIPKKWGQDSKIFWCSCDARAAPEIFNPFSVLSK